MFIQHWQIWFLPQRHVVNAFINFGGRLQNMVDSLSDKLEFMEIDGELEVYLDAFPVLKEVMTVQDDSDNINIRFGLKAIRYTLVPHNF